MAFFICLVNGLQVSAAFSKPKELLPAFTIALSHPVGLWNLLFTYIVSFNVYIVARLGLMGLVFSSLRALPVGTYTTVEWVTSIPHI